MIKKGLLVGLILCMFVGLQAQDNKKGKFYIGAEIGTNHIEGDLKDNLPIRQDVGASYDYYYWHDDGMIFSSINNFYAGLKTEYRCLNDKLGFSAGLRFKGNNVDISRGKYFYLRYANGEDTRYARIEFIDESNYYLGIPLEVRYFPFQWKYVGLYGKIGGDLSYKIKSDLDFEFVNSNMESEKQTIVDNLDMKSSDFYATMYWGIGMKIGKPNGLNFNMEFILPSPILTSNSFALTETDFFTGFRLTVEMPLCSNK